MHKLWIWSGFAVDKWPELDELWLFWCWSLCLSWKDFSVCINYKEIKSGNSQIAFAFWEIFREAVLRSNSPAGISWKNLMSQSLQQKALLDAKFPEDSSKAFQTELHSPTSPWLIKPPQAFLLTSTLVVSHAMQADSSSWLTWNAIIKLLLLSLPTLLRFNENKNLSLPLINYFLLLTRSIVLLEV